jgi:hypothetical protein
MVMKMWEGEGISLYFTAKKRDAVVHQSPAAFARSRNAAALS